MPSSNHIYGEFFEKMCECNTQLFNMFQSKALNSSPMQSALLEQNLQDMGKWVEEAAKQPEKVLHTQMKWWQDQMQIWQRCIMNNGNNEIEPVISPEKGDRRFKDEAWEDHALYDAIKQSYLLFGKNMLGMIEQAQGLPSDVKDRLKFFTRQMVNAVSPTNFISTNPELMRLTLESKGENLVNGLQQFQEDLKSSADVLKISMTSKDAFTIGTDLAVTPGEVIYRNHLMELIQYHPQTETVHQRPIFIVPPFINKYYILDMRRKSSLVNWLVEQGHTVFLISWRNPDESMAESGFDDYVVNGIIAALDAIEEQTGEAHVNAVGYCIGGVLLSTTMAYMVSKRMKQRIKSATLLTTMLDFTSPGEIGVYINEPTISAIEEQNNANGGFMDGRMMGTTFSMLRENSLYWNYYIDNYLKGQSPLDFDLLYWNSDSTNVSAACHSFILRQLYLENNLMKPKTVKIQGTGIDLSKIKIPTYFLSTREDHIADWKSTYDGSKLLSGPTTFVLGESGHIAGVVNPPSKNKYGYWEGGKSSGDSQQWLESAKHHDGSWWEHWNGWLAKLEKDTEQVPARKVEQERSLCPAPGTYVLQQLPIVEVPEHAPTKETTA